MLIEFTKDFGCHGPHGLQQHAAGDTLNGEESLCQWFVDRGYAKSLDAPPANKAMKSARVRRKKATKKAGA